MRTALEEIQELFDKDQVYKVWHWSDTCNSGRETRTVHNLYSGSHSKMPQNVRDKLHLASLRRWLLCRSRDGIRTAREMLNVLADYYFQQDTSWTRSWEMNVCKLYQIVIEKLFSGFHLSRNWFQWLLSSKFQAPSVDPRVTEYAWVSVLDISHQRVCNFRRFKTHWPSFWKNEVAGLGERFNDADGGIDL